MAKPAKNHVQVPVTVTINPDAFEYLTQNAKDGDVGATLAGWCAYWLDTQSRGGITLEPVDHDHLAGLNGGKRFRDSRSLVRAVEKGIRREDGQYSFVFSMDPAHYPAFKETADAAGMTPEEAIQGILAMIFSNGWAYQFTPDQGRDIPFTPQMLASCKELCEKKSIDSSDIAGLIAEGRFLPIKRETMARAKSLVKDQGKAEFEPADLDALLSELEALRAEVVALRTAPREMVAA